MPHFLPRLPFIFLVTFADFGVIATLLIILPLGLLRIFTLAILSHVDAPFLLRVEVLFARLRFTAHVCPFLGGFILQWQLRWRRLFLCGRFGRCVGKLMGGLPQKRLAILHLVGDEGEDVLACHPHPTKRHPIRGFILKPIGDAPCNRLSLRRTLAWDYATQHGLDWRSSLELGVIFRKLIQRAESKKAERLAFSIVKPAIQRIHKIHQSTSASASAILAGGSLTSRECGNSPGELSKIIVVPSCFTS